MVSFEVPSLSYFLLGPILIVLGGAVLSVLAEAFLSRTTRPKVQLGITLLTLVASFARSEEKEMAKRMELFRFQCLQSYESVLYLFRTGR